MLGRWKTSSLNSRLFVFTQSMWRGIGAMGWALDEE